MNRTAKASRQASDFALFSLSDTPLRPLSDAAGREALADLAAAENGGADLGRRLAKAPAVRAFVAAVLSLSPHLRDIALADPGLLDRALSEPIEPAINALCASARQAWRAPDGGTVAEAELMTKLRRAKGEAAFLLAIADLGKTVETAVCARHLSRLACACLQSAIDHLLAAGAQAGKLSLVDAENPSHGSGLIVLGMGKLGAEELNYSSDIDLVVFYDPAAGIAADPMEATDTFARAARRLVRIMQERTSDGYVFRTDLRLRPDPGSTPLAIPVEAALNYYEGRGQNWERAAFIKARPVAGDIEAGNRFCCELIPFVFRKYLDYAAIADIHSIKRQIHAHKGHGEIAVAGHNVKLGRGGIREIEFFVQTQQLIAGGRMPQLRTRRTDEALDALAEAHWISPETAAELKADYWYLRDVEHRIQMVRDEQSHTLPEDDEELKRIALMTGEPDTEAFSKRLVATLRSIEHHYAELFEKEAHLSSETGNLVFTGEGDDPDTIRTLSALGFDRPSDIAHVIRTWHYGRYRATRSVEARERLTELTPQLLAAFGATRRADEALLRFDAFLSGLPAGIQLFSLLGNNPGLLSLMVTIMAAAPRLADIIARRPHVFDGMLDPTVLAELPTRAGIAERIESFVDASLPHEEVLDRLRIVAAEQKFLIGIRLLTGSIDAKRAGEAMSDLADLIIEAAFDAVRGELERSHGRVPDGRAAVVGMGKLGSRELTAGSDIDVILLYDHAAGFEESDGPKPLDPVRYYSRLTQRLVAALSAPTAEGVLYEVDLRLRPSGNKGPVATSITAFRKYQQEDAWTWEHMALSRARVVCGEESLAREAEAEFAAILARPRETKKVAADVHEMRMTIEAEKPPRDVWDLKLVPGGLIDIEFVAQYLALVVAVPDGARPTSTLETLERLGPDVLDDEALATLVDALALYTTITQIVRLCLDGDFDPKDAPAGLLDLLCRALDLPDIAAVEAHLKETRKAVRSVFEACLAARRKPA